MADDGRGDQPGGRMPGRPEPARYVPPSQPSSTSRGIHVEITPRHVRLVPGESETALITVRNLGSVVDEVTLTITGDAAGWARVAPDTLNIYPGTEAQATIRFAPPRAPLPPAGLLELDLAVTSRSQPEASTVYRGSLELGAYDNLSAAAVGSTYLTGKREAILPIKVRNLGNRASGVYLTASDLFGARVTLSSPTLGLEPGAEATVWATIRPTESRSGGAPTQYPFTVSVSSDYTPPITIDGRFEREQAVAGSKRRWPIVAVALVGLGLVAAGTAFVLANPGLLNPPGASTTPTAGAFASGLTGSPTGEPTAPPGEPTPPTDEPPPTDGPPTDGPPTDGPPTDGPPTPTEEPTPYTLTGWELLGGQFGQAPAVASWQANRIDLLAPALEDGQLLHSSFDGVQWGAWQPVGSGAISLKPAAVSWGPGRLDVFAVLEDQKMYQLTYDGFSWSDWQPVGDGGSFSAGPGAASWGPDRLDVFARGTDGMLYHNWWDQSQLAKEAGSDRTWGGWEPHGTGTVVKAPAAVSWNISQGPPEMYIFAGRSDPGPIDQLTYGVDFDWVDWQPLGGEFNAAPAATTWGRGRLDVFGRWTNNTVYQRTYDSGFWTEWQQVSAAQIESAPAAVSWGAGRIDLFAIGADDALYHRWFQDGAWSP